MTKSNVPRSAGRPRSFDRADAVHRAMRVFWERGFEGASLSELTHVMGLKPGSLYAAFGNKQNLFREALHHYLITEVAFIQEALHESTAFAVSQRLLKDSAIFLTRARLPAWLHDDTTSLFVTGEGVQIHEELIALRIKAQKQLRDRFARAKRTGDLSEDADAGSRARLMVSIYQGMTIQSVNGATRKDLLDLAATSLRGWPMTKSLRLADFGWKASLQPAP